MTALLVLAGVYALGCFTGCGMMAIRHADRLDRMQAHHRDRLVMLRRAVEPYVQADLRWDADDGPAVRTAQAIQREIDSIPPR